MKNSLSDRFISGITVVLLPKRGTYYSTCMVEDVVDGVFILQEISGNSVGVRIELSEDEILRMFYICE